MGIFDTIIDESGKTWQTKWFSRDGRGGGEPFMQTYRIDERVPVPDGKYSAVGDRGTQDRVVVVHAGRVLGVYVEGDEPELDEVEPVVDQAVRLLQDLYNNDVLFVELSLAERNEYDRRIRDVLEAFGAEYDGRRTEERPTEGEKEPSPRDNL